MKNPFFHILLANVLLLMMFQGVSHGVTLTQDTLWEGEIKITEDILVPKGIVLTVKSGTHVKVVSAESTKTDPEYLSPLTELTIRGELRVEGTEKSPVIFSGEEDKAGSWAGIVIDQGNATMRFFKVRNAETGIHVINGGLKGHNGILRDNRYGLVVQGSAADSQLADSQITSNDYGLLALQGGKATTKTLSVAGNRKKDSFSAQAKDFDPEIRPYVLPDTPVSRSYKDEVFRGDVIWQGRIEVAGMIRVPQGSRLIIMPGTIVEFLKRDTNGDGIGENGILVQGRLIAKGTKEQPILFRSAENNKKMGDWDSINIMDSAGAQNLIEYCRIEHAYRGLHFHFSSVAIHNTMISDSYRAIQFQESLVDMKNNYLYANKSGVQGRDSDLTFDGNVLHNNYVGANFYRTTLTARGNKIIGNLKEGWRIREGVSTLEGNLVDGNRYGLTLADMFYGEYVRNSFTNNLETGLALKNADNIEVSGNVIARNGINGLNVQDSRALVKGNMISDNAVRGIGVQSFSGLITDNNLMGNGQYAIDLDGVGDVSAPSNWWGGDSPGKVVLDKRTEPARGLVAYDNPRETPSLFVWPLPVISTDTTWRGTILVKKNITVLKGAELRLVPKTTVEFSREAGLLVKGSLTAVGKADEKIRFTSSEKKGPSDWDEIQLEYATGSTISNCIFEYATWGLHVHFTALSISDSHFTNNFGGLRFRSGPVEVEKSYFDNNTIGIRAYIGNAVIRNNSITKNEVGIFVREKGGGLSITGNNIFENSNYNIRVGDFNNEDVPARDNWWGGADPLTTIFDGRAESGIGNVLFEPYRKYPVRLDKDI
jgi:hypothetical protein